MNPKNAPTHMSGTKLISITDRFFPPRNFQANSEQIIIATGYNVMANTNAEFPNPIPLSKLINDIIQMTYQGSKLMK